MSGYDDGSIRVYDYGKNKEKSYDRPIFKVSREGSSAAVELDNPSSIFKETLFEHSDSITCIEKNFKDNKIFLSTGKDSLLNVWRFTENDHILDY